MFKFGLLVIAALASCAYGCGVKKFTKSEDVNDMIPIWDADYIASVRNPSGEVVCTGVIVQEHFIITVASCFDGHLEDASNYSVSIGSTLKGCGVIYNIDKVFIHDSYSSNPEYNIALIKLTSDIIYQPGVIGKGDLPTETSFSFQRGQVFNVTGWGQNYETLQLRQTTASAVTIGQCKGYYSDTFQPTRPTICAKQIVTNNCAGSLGSPLTLDRFVIGLAVTNDNCKACQPQKYTYLPNLDVMRWYFDIIAKNPEPIHSSLY